MRKDNLGSGLEMINGKKLVSVCFVLDYIEFQFEDFVFASLSDPILFQGDKTWTRTCAGYYEGLYEQIGKCVASVAEEPRTLQVRLEGATLVVPLDAPYPPGPEMAMLSGKGTFYVAWLRPPHDVVWQVRRVQPDDLTIELNGFRSRFLTVRPNGADHQR